MDCKDMGTDGTNNNSDNPESNQSHLSLVDALDYATQPNFINASQFYKNINVSEKAMAMVELPEDKSRIHCIFAPVRRKLKFSEYVYFSHKKEKQLRNHVRTNYYI